MNGNLHSASLIATVSSLKKELRLVRLKAIAIASVIIIMAAIIGNVSGRIFLDEFVSHKPIFSHKYQNLQEKF